MAPDGRKGVIAHANPTTLHRVVRDEGSLVREHVVSGAQVGHQKGSVGSRLTGNQRGWRARVPKEGKDGLREVDRVDPAGITGRVHGK